MVNLLTAPILASASPLKPSVEIFEMSSIPDILLVEKFEAARGRSPERMPTPSSETTMRERPPSERSTVIRSASASIAFSINSLQTLAGRSMTSPAAILLDTSGASFRIGGT